MAGVKSRCWWCGEDELYCAYHDKEWGVAVHDDRKIFEMLILEGFQAGLSWITILRKRENFRKAFKNFDARKMARFRKSDIARLMRDAGIIRNRLKIEGAVTNAGRFLEVQQELGSFDRYIWRFTGNRTLRNPKGMNKKSMRATSPESDALSKDLKQRGFKFVGSTVCYAHMQATGMVDDHVVGCFKYRRRGNKVGVLSPHSPAQLGVSPSKSRNPAVRPALRLGAHAAPPRSFYSVQYPS